MEAEIVLLPSTSIKYTHVQLLLYLEIYNVVFENGVDTCNRDADKVFAYKCGHVNYLQTISVVICPTGVLWIKLSSVKSNIYIMWDRVKQALQTMIIRIYMRIMLDN